MILLTGGAGYIGSHTALSLLEKGEEIVIIDNLENSSLQVIQSLKEVSKRPIIFVEGDVRDEELLEDLFSQYNFSGIIHFAASKAVGESVVNPLKYYDNNVGGLVSLLNTCKRHKVSNFIFSSSCTVYGTPKVIPVDESASIQQAASPYGNTKIICEEILSDFAASESWFDFVSLRYFNPIGAHPSGFFGDDPNGIPNNLLPYITRVASGELEELNVFGSDYDTQDGTAVRDYIHVVDLANAHLKAMEYVRAANSKVRFVNIGTGKGYSVLDLIKTFEKTTGVKINYKMVERRPGDVEKIYAKPDLAEKELKWKAQLNLEDMLTSAWKFQKAKQNV